MNHQGGPRRREPRQAHVLIECRPLGPLPVEAGVLLISNKGWVADHGIDIWNARVDLVGRAQRKEVADQEPSIESVGAEQPPRLLNRLLVKVDTDDLAAK